MVPGNLPSQLGILPTGPNLHPKKTCTAAKLPVSQPPSSYLTACIAQSSAGWYTAGMDSSPLCSLQGSYGLCRLAAAARC